MMWGLGGATWSIKFPVLQNRGPTTGFFMLLAKRLVKSIIARIQTERFPTDLPAEVLAAWRGVRKRRLTYLQQAKMESLIRLVLELERRGIDGAIIEAGCAMGGSAIAMCAAKSPKRSEKIYDVFGMIPPPSAADGEDVQNRYETIRGGKSTGIGGDTYYGYLDDLKGRVAASFTDLGYPISENEVELHKGLVQDTLHADGAVALVHIDVDWYEPVKCCLSRLVPHLVVGGSVVLDDYHDWSGCRTAADEFFENCTKEGFRYDDSAGHMVVTRT